MPSRVKTLCVFGDSNLGCLKLAIKDNLIKVPRGLSLEFWGADGPRFRGLDLIDGELIPRESSMETVRLVNGNDRVRLKPGDFDAFFFFGVRLRVAEFSEPLFHMMADPDHFVSDQVFKRSCRDWFPKHRFYRVAQTFAAAEKTRVLLTTNSYQIEDAVTVRRETCSRAFSAKKRLRDQMYTEFTTIASESGIEFIPQPEKTVTAGCLTKAEYTRVAHDGSPDHGHRNPEYGALMLEALFRQL